MTETEGGIKGGENSERERARERTERVGKREQREEEKPVN